MLEEFARRSHPTLGWGAVPEQAGSSESMPIRKPQN